jgi:hypothetical protein
MLTKNHCAMDLRQLIRQQRDRIRANADAVKGRELTPVEEARFEVGTLLLMDLVQQLEEMVGCWDKDHPAYRVTEQALEEAG